MRKRKQVEFETEFHAEILARKYLYFDLYFDYSDLNPPCRIRWFLERVFEEIYEI